MWKNRRPRIQNPDFTMKTSTAYRPAQPTCQNLGCYHAASRRLNPPISVQTVIVQRSIPPLYHPPHAGQPHQRAVDLPIFLQPSESREPPLPYPGHPNHCALDRGFSSQRLRPWPVALRSRPFSARMASPIHRPCLRRQASGILQRLALSVRRRPLVVGQDPGQSLRLPLGSVVLSGDTRFAKRSACRSRRIPSISPASRSFAGLLHRWHRSFPPLGRTPFLLS